jgi:hypothetical protein
MQFRVPQFIDIEDKIFGPFSFRQFVYLVGGGAISFVLYKLLPFFIAILLILPIVGLALALTFYKVNNKPFIETLENWFKFSTQNKLYVWKKKPQKKDSAKEKLPEQEVASYVPKLSESKLKDISWSLDVLDVNKK